MRKSLELDIKGCANKDLADSLKALFEAHNALVAEYDALLAKLDTDGGVAADYVSTLASAAEVDID